MLLRRVFLSAYGHSRSDALWPLRPESLWWLRTRGVTLTGPLTFLTAARQSSGSALLSAIGRAHGLPVRDARFAAEPRLAEAVRLEYTGHRSARQRLTPQGFLLSGSSVAGLLARPPRTARRTGHGDFLTVFEELFQEPELYLIDTPERGLPEPELVRLAARLRELADSGAQVVCATASPVLSATPGARLIDLDRCEPPAGVGAESARVTVSRVSDRWHRTTRRSVPLVHPQAA
ncbi:putative ATPase [Stackebrandtia albiflava]|uniref:Putative ATPase n=1 Tax=Stackebrandtia albiflava TaxID=406432 RepID=A0A562V2V1_9ACTN|nr:hypothetical protein [Stackebrandtia albiflava]TWJ12185.1 putative ATPase [Stackebrandtia albiflava]